jgi:hypothetical protein
MRIARNSRKLSDPERTLAGQVFHGSLPSWGRILIADGLGPLPGRDNPYTDDVGGMYMVNVGPDYYPDLTSFTDYGFASGPRLLIHELTHVWQYDHGYWVILRSAWANRRDN